MLLALEEIYFYRCVNIFLKALDLGRRPRAAGHPQLQWMRQWVRQRPLPAGQRGAHADSNDDANPPAQLQTRLHTVQGQHNASHQERFRWDVTQSV